MTKSDKERISIIETKMEQIESALDEIKRTLQSFIERADRAYPSRAECENSRQSLAEVRSLVQKVTFIIISAVLAAVLSLVIKG